jgi:hypothetical protein
MHASTGPMTIVNRHAKRKKAATNTLSCALRQPPTMQEVLQHTHACSTRKPANSMHAAERKIDSCYQLINRYQHQSMCTVEGLLCGRHTCQAATHQETYTGCQSIEAIQTQPHME